MKDNTPFNNAKLASLSHVLCEIDLGICMCFIFWRFCLRA